jgi:hypothetical protein
VVLTSLLAALRRAVERHDGVSLATFGMLLVVFGQWLNGGYYAISPLVWFAIGFLVASDAGPFMHITRIGRSTYRVHTGPFGRDA